MLLFFRIILWLLLSWLMSSCVSVGKLSDDPCKKNDSLWDLTSYSRSELSLLAKNLSSRSYPSDRSSGCHTALLGRVYEALGQLKKASDAFALASKKLPEVSVYFLLAKARIEIKRQNLDEAHRIASAVLKDSSLPTRFTLRVEQLLAEIARQKKDHVQIVATHQRLMNKGHNDHELLFNLATALAKAGEHEKASTVFKKLLIEFPHLTPKKTTDKLHSLAGHQLSPQDIEKRFDKLMEQGAYDQVVKDARTLKSASSVDAEVKEYAQTLAIKALLINRQFAKGLRESTTLMKQKNATPKALESHAFALGKLGRLMEAAKAYQKFLVSAVDPEDKAKGCFFAGFSLYEASLYSMALSTWENCHKAIRNTELYENYLWYQALSYLLSGNYTKSHALLGDLQNRYKKSDEREKYGYFLGYTLHRLDQIKEGDALMVKSVNKSQPTYYSLLAKKTLGLANFRGLALPSDALQKRALLEKDQDCQNASMLYHLGFADDARDLVFLSKASAQNKLGLLQQMGFYHDAWQRAHQLKIGAILQKERLTDNIGLRASYPSPHRATIDQVAKKYLIDPSLLYAIMQIESGFLTTAQSTRGALGLMQMMPEMAQDLSSHIKTSEFSPKDLTKPEVAIELAALLLAILKRQFNDTYLVVAAYNAGPHHVQKWRDRFGHLPWELFVERIPFKETRNYTKKVLAAKSLYEAMDGQDLRLTLH
ncbi:MAG TPA: transglycosylase SLT domain-containing protein [Myxococcota bacterium]|nr:transglycosylase SLT domain-containing protein [Myxococcota bacterium]